jgi:8-oxo-dGTP pyrophosphatase MutT (NUDIX family)
VTRPSPGHAAATWGAVSSALGARPRRFDPPLPNRAAVALVLRESVAADLEILLVRRAQHPADPWSGHMAFPGGRFEDRDGSLLATAVRETAEETGLTLEPSHLLGALDEIRATGRGRVLDLSIAPFVFRCAGNADAHLSDELVSAHWIDLNVLVAEPARGTVPIVLHNRTWGYPCLRVDGQVVWGLTYRMLSDFVRRLGLADLPRDPEGAP